MAHKPPPSEASSGDEPSRRDVLNAGAAATGASLFGAACRTNPSRQEAAQQPYTAEQRALIDVWERHTEAEFVRKDADAAIDTMTAHPVLTHVPVGSGATGREPLRRFYRDVFIPQMPEDARLELLTRTVGQERVIDEFILRLTHTVRMEWFAPGVEPTGRTLEIPHMGVIQFQDGKIASEHIYWDHATVLAQLGVLDIRRLPVLGREQCDRLRDPSSPANRLQERKG